MRLNELAQSEIRQRLAGPGLRLRTGPFVYALRTRMGFLADAIGLLYADFPLAADDGFSDFHVTIRPIRRHPFATPEAVITIEGQSNFYPFPRAMTMAYFEWGLNWCVANIAHDRLVVHAASLEREGRAVLIVGESGAGKSTLSAGLAADGWRLLSDEFALVSPQDGRLSALARPISLKNESIDLIARRFPGVPLGPVASGERKGTIRHLRPNRAWIDRAEETALPAWILLLDYRADAATELARAAKGATMMRLIRNSFNYGLLGRTGFHTLADTVERCDCYQLTYGNLDDAVARLRSLARNQGDATLG